MPACIQISLAGVWFPKKGEFGLLHTFAVHLFTSQATVSQPHFPTVTYTNSNPCNLIPIIVHRALPVRKPRERLLL